MCERDRQNFRSSSRGAADCAAAAVPLPQLRSQHCVVHLHREQLSVTPTQRCNFRGHIAQTFSEDKREPPALSGSAAKRLRVCVCVCHPPSPGVCLVFKFHFRAGGSRVCSWRESTKLQVQTRISRGDALSTYLRPTH